MVARIRLGFSFPPPFFSGSLLAPESRPPPLASPCRAMAMHAPSATDHKGSVMAPTAPAQDKWSLTGWKAALPGHIQIFVRMLRGKIITLDMKRSDTICHVKAMIHNLEGLPHDEQRLVLAGRQLDCRRSLRDYNIRQGESLHLLSRLRGGMQTDSPSRSLASIRRDRLRRQLGKETSVASGSSSSPEMHTRTYPPGLWHGIRLRPAANTAAWLTAAASGAPNHRAPGCSPPSARPSGVQSPPPGLGHCATNQPFHTDLERLAARVPFGRIQDCHMITRINHPALRAAWALSLMRDPCSPFSRPCTWCGTPVVTRCESCPSPVVFGARTAAAHACNVCSRRFGACRDCCGCSHPACTVDTRGPPRLAFALPHWLEARPPSRPDTLPSHSPGVGSEGEQMPSHPGSALFGPLPAHGLRFGQEIPGVGTTLVLATRSESLDDGTVELGLIWCRGSRQRVACFTATARGEPFVAPAVWPSPTPASGIAQGDPSAPGLWELFVRAPRGHRAGSSPSESRISLDGTDFQLAD